jgi:hypothetical protein
VSSGCSTIIKTRKSPTTLYDKTSWKGRTNNKRVKGRLLSKEEGTTVLSGWNRLGKGLTGCLVR